MINENELRIGNWVQNDVDYKWQFEDFGELADQFSKYRNTEARVEVFPIPLTPEILIACGFENTVGNNFVLDDFRVRFDETGVYVFYQQSLRIKKEYLHQLQNLYFALTGEELKVKL